MYDETATDRTIAADQINVATVAETEIEAWTGDVTTDTTAIEVNTDENTGTAVLTGDENIVTIAKSADDTNGTEVWNDRVIGNEATPHSDHQTKTSLERTSITNLDWKTKRKRG